MAGPDVAEGVGCFVEGVGAVDDRRDLPGREQVALENNPKFTFRVTRPLVSQVIYFDNAAYVERNVGNAWTIVRRP
jgi:hypothetical protein